MLKIDFYESGPGETIVITFPKGGLGIVDAHPSPTKSRCSIEDIIKGKEIHFVCLTHPHQDHGRDLAKVLKSKNSISEFWYTVRDIKLLAYSATNIETYPSRYRHLIEDMRKDSAGCFLDIFEPALKRNNKNPNFLKSLSNELEKTQIDGVEIFCLSPSRVDQNSYLTQLQNKLEGKSNNKPNENKISAVLVIKYGQIVTILGSDALVNNWNNILKKSGNMDLPKARILKVPHHGAKNALSKDRNKSYLRLCSNDPQTYSILFAGDIKHPNGDVHEILKNRTNLNCLNNGLKVKSRGNPLNIDIPGVVETTKTGPLEKLVWVT